MLSPIYILEQGIHNVCQTDTDSDKQSKAGLKVVIGSLIRVPAKNVIANEYDDVSVRFHGNIDCCCGASLSDLPSRKSRRQRILLLSLAPEKRKADMTESSRGMRVPILHQYRIQNHRTQMINRRIWCKRWPHIE